MSIFDHFFRLDYSRDLHQQLKGLSADCSGYYGDAIYQITAIVLLLVSMLVMLNYYYGVLNNPRFTHRRVWLLNILAACAAAGIFAYFRAVAGLPEEGHCADIHFTVLDCLLYAATVMIYTFIACLIFSLLFKWKSVANKKIPF